YHGTSFKSSWYLSSVTTANNDDAITFTYQPSAPPYTYKYFVERDAPVYYQNTFLGENCYNNLSSSGGLGAISVTINTPIYLSAITTAQAKISFYNDNSRDDLPGAQRISRIIVTDNQSIRATVLICITIIL